MTINNTGSTRFPSPHAELTPIRGKPTAITVKQLQKEVFANTRAVHSARGGGVNSYFGIAMEPWSQRHISPERASHSPHRITPGVNRSIHPTPSSQCGHWKPDGRRLSLLLHAPTTRMLPYSLRHYQPSNMPWIGAGYTIFPG
jgi:hypothetical protein